MVNRLDFAPSTSQLNVRYLGMVKKKGTGARELIDTGRNKSYARRDGNGQFTEMVDQGRSLSADARQHAKKKKPAKQGDKGD